MSAVPNMAVSCSSLTSWFPGMLLTYFLNEFKIGPIAPIITGITFVFTFNMRCIFIVRSLYCRIFSVSFLVTFLSPEIATSIYTHVPFSLSPIIMSGLLLGIVLSVCTCWLHNMVTLPPWLVSADFGTCSYQCFCPSVSLFPCILLLLSSSSVLVVVVVVVAVAITAAALLIVYLWCSYFHFRQIILR